MSALLDARTGLASALSTAEWFTHTAPPELVAPPCVLIQPAENYLQPADEALTYAGPVDYLVTVELWVIADLVASEQAIDQLDVMQEWAVAHLPRSWWLESTGQPDTVNNGEWQAYGNRLTVQTELRIEKEVTP